MTGQYKDRDAVHVSVTGIELRATEAGYECGYVGWGSRRAKLITRNPTHLGFCFNPDRAAKRGLIWDLSFGFVSGFPLRALLWFAFTRSLSPRWFYKRVEAWEKRTGRYDGTIFDVLRGDDVSVRSLTARFGVTGTENQNHQEDGS